MTQDDSILAELKALREEVQALRTKVTAPVGGLLTVRQAAARLNCSPRQVFRFLELGKLTPGRKLGRERTVTLTSIVALEGPEGKAPLPEAPVAAIPFNVEAELAKLDQRPKVALPDDHKRRRGAR